MGKNWILTLSNSDTFQSPCYTVTKKSTPQKLLGIDSSLRLRLHEQIKPPLIAQILDPYEVTAEEFEQIKYVLCKCKCGLRKQ